MEKISSEVLKNWMKGEKFEGEPFFVIIKTPACGKCESLIRKDLFLKKPDHWFKIYNFTATDKLGAELLQNMEISSVPVILFRFELIHKNFSKYFVGIITPNMNDLTDIENMFDAIYDNDHKYFGYDEFGEAIEDSGTEVIRVYDIHMNKSEELSYNYVMEQLLNIIFGEPSSKKEREKFRESIN